MRLALGLTLLGLTAALLAGFGIELAAGDYWRTLGFGVALVCLVVVAPTLVRQP